MLSADRSLTYTNAGHNAPVLVTVAGSTRRLETGGMVLGLFDQAGFEEETIPLQPGDTLIVFSDGVSEALNDAGEEFGDERLLALVDRHHHHRRRRCSTRCSAGSANSAAGPRRATM